MKKLRLSQAQAKKLFKKLRLGFSPAKNKIAPKKIPVAMQMDAIGKELEGNRAILHVGIHDEEQWAKNEVHARASKTGINV